MQTAYRAFSRAVDTYFPHMYGRSNSRWSWISYFAFKKSALSSWRLSALHISPPPSKKSCHGYPMHIKISEMWYWNARQLGHPPIGQSLVARKEDNNCYAPCGLAPLRAEVLTAPHCPAPLAPAPLAPILENAGESAVLKLVPRFVQI